MLVGIYMVFVHFEGYHYPLSHHSIPLLSAYIDLNPYSASMVQNFFSIHESSMEMCSDIFHRVCFFETTQQPQDLYVIHLGAISFLVSAVLSSEFP